MSVVRRPWGRTFKPDDWTTLSADDGCSYGGWDASGGRVGDVRGGLIYSTDPQITSIRADFQCLSVQYNCLSEDLSFVCKSNCLSVYLSDLLPYKSGFRSGLPVNRMVCL